MAVAHTVALVIVGLLMQNRSAGFGWQLHCHPPQCSAPSF